MNFYVPLPVDTPPGQVRTGSVESLEQFPSLRKLPMRELDLLMELAPHLPETTGRLIELSQSAGRHVADSSTETKTLLPKGVVFHTGRGAPLAGFEVLRVMGIWIPTQLEGILENRTLCDLGGNAFETTCLLATTIAALAVRGAK